MDVIGQFTCGALHVDERHGNVDMATEVGLFVCKARRSQVKFSSRSNKGRARGSETILWSESPCLRVYRQFFPFSIVVSWSLLLCESN